MQKPSPAALEAVYGYVLRELLPKMVANQPEAAKKPPLSASGKEQRPIDENKA
ncbi:UNVERIFIED_CONTAM: hypothetical protein ABID98_000446 [Brevibacillus sp. OAP136]|uniref:hypothetical protein n=1 Tax=Brevibacillus fluminis TaxID=511487 RepID=UPI00160577FA|nr:hypothetical protein [Brevibacillus fluminis]